MVLCFSAINCCENAFRSIAIFRTLTVYRHTKIHFNKHFFKHVDTNAFLFTSHICRRHLKKKVNDASTLSIYSHSYVETFIIPPDFCRIKIIFIGLEKKTCVPPFFPLLSICTRDRVCLCQFFNRNISISLNLISSLKVYRLNMTRHVCACVYV